MNIRALATYVAVAMFLLFAYAIVAELFFDECGLEEEQAREMVLEQLALRGLDPKYLSVSDSNGGSCSYYYKFEGQGQILSYEVMSTWSHGVKISWLDNNREEDEITESKLDKADLSESKP
ncbi:hypothetical protein GCM10010960_17080 [Arenimonas maotaiensis]|uniref:Uncharacterized protein n=1 Tax=Arenimonas maotaiensis TaxID=1446479 RepID=A0A917CSU5_9GAMM|nr:hypothetical protein [Arenimonas maotaiensis]GGF95985.1 hypothetical protein GCM10010960_17080 [Arenimonas maotaiensis]